MKTVCRSGSQLIGACGPDQLTWPNFKKHGLNGIILAVRSPAADGARSLTATMVTTITGIYEQNFDALLQVLISSTEMTQRVSINPHIVEMLTRGITLITKIMNYIFH